MGLAHKVTNFIYLSSSIGGALLVALNIGAQVFGYVLFLVSSLTGIILLRKSNAPKSLLIVNIVFAVINTIGLFRA